MHLHILVPISLNAFSHTFSPRPVHLFAIFPMHAAFQPSPIFPIILMFLPNIAPLLGKVTTQNIVCCQSLVVVVGSRWEFLKKSVINF